MRVLRKCAENRKEIPEELIEIYEKFDDKKLIEKRPNYHGTILRMGGHLVPLPIKF